MANAIVRAGLVWAIAAGSLWSLAAQAAGADNYVTAGSKAEQLDACVEPTDFMRRNHMEVIKHQRDETVYSGIRSTKHSLSGCVECHVSYDPDNRPVAVDAQDQFCAGCHEFAAVGMDCFGCHASVPSYRAAGASGAAARGHLDWHPPLAMAGPKTQVLKPGASGEGTRP